MNTATLDVRLLHCTVMSLEGLSLDSLLPNEVAGTPTPAELVETILHAMIGEYSVFTTSIQLTPYDLRSLQPV